MDINVDRIIFFGQTVYNWLGATIPYPWLPYLLAAAALYVGYLAGQFILAERLRHEGYEILVWHDDLRGRRRYMVQGNGLEIIGDYGDDD